MKTKIEECNRSVQSSAKSTTNAISVEEKKIR